jgi:5-methylthioribose kinase
MSSNFTPSDAANENPSSLTSELAVQKYLRSTAFSSRKVIRLRGGTTNYTFRLYLQTPYGEDSPRGTAILKYATPFVASTPLVPFSVDRQRYEARALRELPKSMLLGGGRAANLHDAKVGLPELYLEDMENNVLIMEDVAPPADVEPKRITCTLLIFLTNRSSVLIQIPNPVQIMEQAGVLLGAFLARLHCWGKAEQNVGLVKSLFRDNTPARETCVETTFRDFLLMVEGRGISLTANDREDVLFEMGELERGVFYNPETLTMGDFWQVYTELLRLRVKI